MRLTSRPVSPRRARGARAEAAGVAFLQKRGYAVVERNYHGTHGELDVIAERDGVLCFVEIRARRGSAAFDPASTVDREKQRRVIRTAREWLLRNKIEGRPCRFDVLGIREPLAREGVEPAAMEFELFEDAFEATDT